MLKKVISVILVIIWMIIIFYFSNEDAKKSSKLSNGVVDKTIVKIYKRTKKYNPHNERIIVEKFDKPIRKLAHFFEYFILGILVINMFYSFDIKKHILLYTLFFCFLYACTDEIHQLFISGRSCEISDVCIDSFGGLLGSLGYKKIIIKK